MWPASTLVLLSGILSLIFPNLVSGRLLGIPTIPFNATNGSYPLRCLKSVIVDSRYASAVDNEGWTLIPPTLEEFAETFAADINSQFGFSLPVKRANSAQPDSIFLTVNNSTTYRDAAGRPTSEGYSLSVSKAGVVIQGASPLGAWWGTRTVLQLALLSKSNDSLTIPYGSGTDAPGWGTRGIMLDAARHYFPPAFMKELCAYLSFFKQNVFHVHLSDNLYANPNYTYEETMSLYAAFRPNSPDPAVAGLNKRNNESYYQDDLDDMQNSCAQRGVTIVPEIEAPGHALVITQWKPELALDDYSLLNITYTETIPTMKTIWSVFLSWFHSKVVHLGADEYTGQVSEYSHLVNTLNDYIATESGKQVRIWGTFTPEDNATINTNISIQHWEYFEDNPYYDYIMNGYSVLNSDDAFYVVNKWSGSYPPVLNLTRVFEGNPANGSYAPYIFDTSNATNNPARNNSYVLGQVAAIWNDYGPNATSYSETYYALRDALPALGDKQWGGDLTLSEYFEIFDTLHAGVPGQNLDFNIPSKTNLILAYDSFNASGGNMIMDTSGNGYDGTLHGATITNGTVSFSGIDYISTPLTAKGRNYTLSFSVRPTSHEPASLFAYEDRELRTGNGTSNKVMLFAAGNAFALNYTLPVGTWVDVELTGRGNATYLRVNRGAEQEFLAILGINGEYHVWAPIAVEAPLQTIGKGFKGQMKNIKLFGSAMSLL